VTSDSLPIFGLKVGVVGHITQSTPGIACNQCNSHKCKMWNKHLGDSYGILGMDYKTTSRMRVCLKTGMLQNCHQTMWKTHFLNQIEIIQNLRCAMLPYPVRQRDHHFLVTIASPSNISDLHHLKHPKPWHCNSARSAFQTSSIQWTWPVIIGIIGFT